MKTMMAEMSEDLFDAEHYDTIFTVLSRLQFVLVTLCFARKKTTNEHFLTIKTLEKIEKKDEAEKKNDGVRVLRMVLRELNGRISTRSAMEKLSQILNKIPKCLIETLDAIEQQHSHPIRFINIFCTELLFLIDQIPQLTNSKYLEVFVASLLIGIRELYESAGHYRAEEFLFVVRNKILPDLEGAKLFVIYYLDYGHAQLVDLNGGAYIMNDCPQILSSILNKINKAEEDHPTNVFESLLASKSLSLPDYDCF